MTRPMGSLVCAVAVMLVATVGAVLAPAERADASPTAPLFPDAIDDYADYDGADTCDSDAKPGATELLNLLLDAYDGTSGYVSRSCTGNGNGSEHEEGRAVDWMISASQHAYTDDFFDWVLAKDTYGNSDAMVRRLGIMYMIWDHRVWRAYDADAGWQPYNGPNPHTDHVHISMSWDGALERTSWTTKQDAGLRLDQARFAATWRDKSSKRLDVFQRDRTGELEHRTWQGSWSGWESLGGKLDSGPAAVWASKRKMWVFAKSNDGMLIQRKFTPRGGWREWHVTNTEISAAPGVAADGGGRIDMVIRTPSGSIDHRYWLPKKGWSHWEPLGGVASAPPAAVWSAADRFDVLIRGTNGFLYQNVWRAGVGWAGWQSLGGVLTSGPAAMSYHDGEASVFVRTDRGTVSTRDRAVDWGGWVDLGGQHASGIAATGIRDVRKDLFTRPPTDGLYQDYYFPDSGWSGWRPQ